MTDTVLVRPRRGLILDGIPRQGAEVSAELAEDWIANQLVERIQPAVNTPEARSVPTEAGTSRHPKRRSTR